MDLSGYSYAYNRTGAMLVRGFFIVLCINAVLERCSYEVIGFDA